MMRWQSPAMDDTNDFLDRLGGPALLAWHRRNGTAGSADDYLALYRDRLRRGLGRTHLIYLDTNFWVWLRRAALGDEMPKARRLLDTLRAMVRSREALCVSQLYSLLEIGKQEPDSLRASADLLDELTEGVVLATPDDLLAWECAEFIEARLRPGAVDGLCPWTKVGQIHTSRMPPLPGPCTPADAEAIYKCMVDATWNMSFTYALGRMAWDTKNRLAFEFDRETLEKLAQRKVDQLAKGAKRSEVRLGEFAQQVRDKAMPLLKDLLRRWHVAHGFPEGTAGLLRDVDVAGRSAVDGFADGKLGRLLPSLCIMTELYALHETDAHTAKPLNTNDWFDSCHAAAALPYCNAFLTEGGLAHRLRAELKADARYGCEVIGSLDDAVARYCRIK